MRFVLDYDGCCCSISPALVGICFLQEGVCSGLGEVAEFPLLPLEKLFRPGDQLGGGIFSIFGFWCSAPQFVPVEIKPIQNTWLSLSCKCGTIAGLYWECCSVVTSDLFPKSNGFLWQISEHCLSGKMGSQMRGMHRQMAQHHSHIFSLVWSISWNGMLWGKKLLELLMQTASVCVFSRLAWKRHSHLFVGLITLVHILYGFVDWIAGDMETFYTDDPAMNWWLCDL